MGVLRRSPTHHCVGLLERLVQLRACLSTLYLFRVTLSTTKIMAAQLEMKDEQLGRFLPSIYHTVHDADKQQWEVVMEYLDPSHLAIAGGLDMPCCC